MTNKKRFLTKSRFKVAHECSAKLNYLDNPKYGNTMAVNDFMKALAEGGFQVGALAMAYYPTGVNIDTLDKEEALKQTNELLKQEQVVIFEAAIMYKDSFIRVDILEKKGKLVKLIEVKAKSFEPSLKEELFYNKTKLKKGIYEIKADYEPYLIDVAYQSFVLKNAYPEFQVSNYLMLADKEVTASVDGLNQLFLLETDENGRTKATAKKSISAQDLGEKVLCLVDVNEEVSRLLDMEHVPGLTFAKYVDQLSKQCVSKETTFVPVKSDCKSCEYRISQEMKDQGLKSGFDECWMQSAKLTPEQLKKPLIFDIWNYKNSADLLQQGVFFAADITEEDISGEISSDADGLSYGARQWKQVEYAKSSSKELFVLADELKARIEEFSWPFNMIDFETTMSAIPFHNGRRPYEQLAFQFSHHILHKDGRVEHANQYIHTEPGVFPNFEFVRALRLALSKNTGTVFRFSHHENTVLRQIRAQILEMKESVKDCEQLVEFIDELTQQKDAAGKKYIHQGRRNMIDLCELVQKFYYHPAMGGSYSIKKVLPAVLNGSKYLQGRYSKPIYGIGKEIPSLNFGAKQWLELDSNGKVKDPYKSLDPIFENLNSIDSTLLVRAEKIKDGGAAATAFARMQFTEMTDKERSALRQALLNYCELDTLAMVMIMEHWLYDIAKYVKKVA